MFTFDPPTSRLYIASKRWRCGPGVRRPSPPSHRRAVEVPDLTEQLQNWSQAGHRGTCL